MSLEIKIVNATIDIFREKGVKFTMDDLANRLGVSKRTLYENIDSKETLLNLLVDEVFDSVTEKGKEVINDDSIGDLEKLKRVLTILPTSYDTIDYTKIHEVKKFYPKIYEKTNKIDNLKAIISLILCSNLFGIIGVLIAIPFYIILEEVIKELIKKTE